MTETIKATKCRQTDKVLEEYLKDLFGSNRRVLEIKRTPSEYQSSFAIEDVEISFEDSSELHVLFKNLGLDGLLPEAEVSKPQFLFNPMREIRTYSTILSAANLGTPICYGFVADPLEDRYWLFLEKVKGIELYQVGDLTLWERAAEWLARLHREVSRGLYSIPSRCHLLNYDSKFYRLWLARARRFCQRPEIEWIAARYDAILQNLLDLPFTFIHGEFYASNVILAGTADTSRVVAVDWEMAAVGPPLMDLAALTSGKWAESERKQIASAYWNVVDEKHKYRNSFDAFLESIEYCRLHICIQWLGWAPAWVPPQAHTNDWLGDAVRIARRLGIGE